MEPFLGGTSEMVIELDSGTAALPVGSARHLVGRAHGQRPAAVGDPQQAAAQAAHRASSAPRSSDANADGSILVIGEPMLDESMYPPLPGARAEAVAVATRLTGGPAGVDAARVRALTSGNDDARNIINALFERPYRIVHVAGHGAPGPDGGVVLSGGTYLGAAEVKAMRTVPELVFLNCCHLAARDARTVLAPYDRAEFAADIAEALIEIGVRCVIAAGWAVEDKPAEMFATTFYDALLGGARFIDAVAAARSAAWRARRRRQHLVGVPVLRRPGLDLAARRRRRAARRRRAERRVRRRLVAAGAHARARDDLDPPALRRRRPGAEKSVEQAQRDKIRFLEAKFAPLWGKMGAVAEAFGLAFADARDVDKAIEWYRVAVQAEDGSASFKAAEELGNQLARRGEARADLAAGRRDVEEAIARLQQAGRDPADGRARGAARLGVQAAGDDRGPRQAQRRGGIGGTAGAQARQGRGRGARRRPSRRVARDGAHYGNAERLAREANADNLFYPAKNGISAELRLAFLERRPAELAVDRMRAVQESLARAASERPDFWSVVGQIELRVLVARRRAAAGRRIAGADRRLHAT